MLRQVIGVVVAAALATPAVAVEYAPLTGIGLINPGPAADFVDAPPPVTPIGIRHARIPADSGGGSDTRAPFERLLAPALLLTPPPPLATSFIGLTATGFYPPDPQIAAGPDELVEIVNGAIALSTKAGVITLQRGLTNYFNGSLTGAFAYDPKIVYDPHTQRFFVVSLDGESSPNWIRVAVSKSSAPANLDVGPLASDDWYGFDIDAQLDGGMAINNYSADFPGLGVDKSDIYITANMFSSAGVPIYAKLWVIPKTGLLAGGPISVFEFGGPPGATLFNPGTNGNDFSIQPVVNYDLTNEHLLTTNFRGGPNGHMTFWTITRASTTPMLSRVDLLVAPWNGSAFGGGMPDCAQLGGGQNIDTQGTALLSATERNGRIWTTHAQADDPNSPARTQVRWYEIDPTGPSVVQMGDVQDAMRCYFYPAILPDAQDNVTLVMSGVDASIYGSTFYTTRFSTDPLGMMHAVASLKAGESNYVQIDNFARNRWGDFGGIAEDPVTGDTWFLHEYASATPNQWSTWVGSIAVHDAVAAPVSPLNVTLPVVTGGVAAVTKKLHIKVTNADAPSAPALTIGLTSSSDCPVGTVDIGAPDFAPPAAMATVMLAGRSSKTALVPITISSSFVSYNRHAPTRCTLTFTAVATDGSTDPTPDNNVVTVELNVIDKNDPDSATPHESVLRSLAPLKVVLGKGQIATTKKVHPIVVNADAGENPGDVISVVASDGDCPAGTVQSVQFPLTATNATTVPGHAAQKGTLPLFIDGSLFTTANGKAPRRCTAVLTATGPSNPDHDPTNNVTKLMIDIVDHNDF